MGRYREAGACPSNIHWQLQIHQENVKAVYKGAIFTMPGRAKDASGQGKIQT